MLAAVVRSAQLGMTWPALGGEGTQVRVPTNLLTVAPCSAEAAVALSAGVWDLRELVSASGRRLMTAGMMARRLGCTLKQGTALRDELVRRLRPECEFEYLV